MTIIAILSASAKFINQQGRGASKNGQPHRKTLFYIGPVLTLGWASGISRFTACRWQFPFPGEPFVAVSDQTKRVTFQICGA